MQQSLFDSEDIDEMEKQAVNNKKTGSQKETVFNDQTNNVFEQMQKVLETKKKFIEERKKWRKKGNRK